MKVVIRLPYVAQYQCLRQKSHNDFIQLFMYISEIKIYFGSCTGEMTELPTKERNCFRLKPLYAVMNNKSKYKLHSKFSEWDHLFNYSY